MSFTLGNQLIAKLHAIVPLYGVATADIELDGGAVLTGRQTLITGDLSHVGTITEGGVSSGRGCYQWNAGAASWRKTIAARGYDSPQGVLRSSVIRDAAEACGESVALGSQATRLGLVGAAGYVRVEGPAWNVFRALAESPQGRIPWHVDTSGVTQIIERVGGAASTDGTVEGWWPSEGRMVIVPNGEKIAGYMPGKTLGGAKIVELHITAAPGEPIRLTIWTATTEPSHALRTALGRIISQETAPSRFHGRYRYYVVARNGSLFDLEPVDQTLGLPRIKNRELWPGIPGCDANIMPGGAIPEEPPIPRAIVVLSFLDGLASEPVIDGFQRLSAGATAKPTLLELDAARINIGLGAKLVGREDDPTKNGSVTIDNGFAPGPLSITLKDASGADVKNWAISASNGGGPVLFTVIPTPLVGGFEAPIDGVIGTPNQSVTYA